MAGIADRVLLQVANRAALKADIVKAVQDIDFQGSMESAPALTVRILDPDDDLLRSNLMVRRAQRAIGTAEAFTLRPIDLLHRGIPYRLTDTSRSGAFVDLIFEHRGVAYMRQHDSAMSASRAATTRALFVRRQVRAVGRNRPASHRMAFWAPDLRLRQPIAAIEEDETSENAEPDRDVSANREDARAFEGVTIKGVRADGEQRRNLATAFSAVAGEDVPRKALVAMALAPIGENSWRSGKNLQGSGATGPFQVMPATASGLGVSLDDFGMHATIFLVGMPSGRYKGKSFTSGPPAATLARQNPGISAAEIVDRVEGGGAGAAFYGRYLREAEAIVEAASGVSGSDFSDGGSGSYVKQYRFSRPEGEDAWTNTGKLAEEVVGGAWRRFVTIPAPKTDVFIFAYDLALLRFRPQAAFAPDDPEVVRFDYDLTMGKTARTATVELLPGKLDLAWGLPVMVKGGGPPGGKWLVWDVQESSGGATVTVELRQPQPKGKEPASERVQRADPSDLALGDGLVTGLRGLSPKEIIDTIVLPMARDAGISISASEVAAANGRHGPTVSGTRSDHQGPPEQAWAADISDNWSATNGTPAMTRLAKALAEAFGIPGNGPAYPAGASVTVRGGLRFQLIYLVDGTNNGGNHKNHVHFGIRVGASRGVELGGRPSSNRAPQRIPTVPIGPEP